MAMFDKLPRHVKIGDDVICQALQQEMVLMKLSSQEYYGLGEVGTHAWQLLVENGDISAVADRLCEDYEGDRAVIRIDFHALVGDLVEAGLLEAVEGP
jgi:hypothetical protein